MSSRKTRRSYRSGTGKHINKHKLAKDSVNYIPTKEEYATFNRPRTSIKDIVEYIEYDISSTKKYAPNQKCIWLRFDENITNDIKKSIKDNVERACSIKVWWIESTLKISL